MLKVYRANTDQIIEVTQEDIDNLQKACTKLASKNDLIKLISNLNIVKHDKILEELTLSLSQILNRNKYNA